MRHRQQPSAIKQWDLLGPDCPVCFGFGRVPWACDADQLVNFYRLRLGKKSIGRVPPGAISFTVCIDCEGTGRMGGRARHPVSARGAF